MSKKNEELKVVASEPLESIDDSSKVDEGAKDDEKSKESTTATPSDKAEDKKEDEEVKKNTDEKKKDAKEKPLPEVKKEESPSESKKERKSVSFKSEVDATEEVPINDEEDKAPPQPPRPKDPVQQVIDELKAAFPNIEEKLVVATLIASQGNPDPAFNALLYISDPSFKPEIPVYVAAPEPNALGKKNSNELTDDELLARKLQKEFELEDRRNRRKSQERRRQQQGRQQQQQRSRRSDEDFDDSPDEFEQIKETFTQGLEDARTTLNGWVSNLARRFDGATEGQLQQQLQQRQQSENPKLFGALGGSSFNENKRKSNRFDEDPEIISNDFHDRIRLQDNDTEETPSLPTRPKTDTAKAEESTTKKQWQPLETENANSDAFLVTDSEDEDIIETTTNANTTNTTTPNKK
ncbi:Ubiquitin-binding protein CUE5 [Candida viswanathii]|uniref:Ubiquitin-binding protein CUE5 n=1 Tax=Candida viswanathii TaxID=5486 RepID=A0A367Y434_9ASCO|nr:Ubiquitin-binding protein CUE5 [Candida viswanathii]